MAAPVNQIRSPVADRAEARENRDLVLDGLQRFQLRHDLIAAAGLGRHPARAARRRVRQTQPPEICAEPDRQLRSIGECRAIAVEEPSRMGRPT